MKFSRLFNDTRLLCLFALLFSISVQSVEFGELDETLNVMERKRTQDPEYIVNSLIKLESLFAEMTQSQKYRIILLKAHSLGMNNKIDDAIELLNRHVNNNYSLELQFYRARMLSLLANSYAFNNQFSKSLQTLQELLPLLADIDDIESEIAGYRLAIEIFSQVKLQQEALHYANNLYQKFDKITLPRHKCFVIFHYSQSLEGVYGSLESKWSEVQGLYKNAYELCNLANEKMIMAGAALGQARMLINKKSFTQAKELVINAKKLATSLPYPHDIANAYVLLAQIEAHNGQSKVQFEILDKALNIAVKLGDSKLLSQVYKPLAEVSEELGQNDNALEYLKLYQKNHEKILGETQNKIIAFETTKLDYLEKEREIRYLNHDRELYTAKAELTESQRNIERMLFVLISGSLVILTIFAISMTLQKRKYKRLAQFDVLTGIYNRGTGQEIAENRYVKDSITGADFSVVLFDLDNFKNINDSYGHAMGDWVLQKVCSVVSDECRSRDIFTRFGGEEFALFMPNTDNQMALKMAEKLRSNILAIETHSCGHEFIVSASFGVTTSLPTDLSLDPVLKRADIAMYQSKAQGRNRVSVYTQDINDYRD